MATAPKVKITYQHYDRAIYNHSAIEYIEEVPEIMICVDVYYRSESYKMKEAVHYTKLINIQLSQSTNLQISEEEYINMIDRFIRFGSDYYYMMLKHAQKKMVDMV